MSSASIFSGGQWAGASFTKSVHQMSPPGDHGDVLAGALEHHHRPDVGALLERGVHVELQGHDAAPAVAAVGGDHHGGFRVVDAVADRVGGEAAEDDAVGRPDARAREHGDGRLGHHGHVDGDAIAPLDPVLLEGRGEAIDLAVEVPVGQGAGVAGLPLPDEGGLGAAGGIDVPVQAVVRDIELAADEPLGVGRLPRPAPSSTA